ncbi:nuclear transport factor 2 family protein [Chitinophaga sp.]|uniref:nuclear transport factor 2 family protein n=1 Tax=Chitinophaga sp. TaxID=1869181 RepID=UPI0031DA4495
MITRQQALDFAHEWVAAWNSHNLERVLSHYTDDFEMSSPFIVAMGIDPSGTLKGKNNVRDYWSKAMEKYPDLSFGLIEVLSCVNTVIIYYTSIAGKKAAEFFVFNEEGKVYKAMGHYD